MSYNLLAPVHAIDAGDMSLTSITSAVVETKLQDNIGIQLNWTGTAAGTFDFQISMDHKEDASGNVQVAGNFVSVPISPAITASGSADSAYVDLNQISAPYFRIVYTKNSGSGTLDAYVNGKGV